MYTDRNATCIEDLCIIEGMAVAAVVDVVIQLWQKHGHYECIDVGQTVISAVVGGVTGGLGGKALTGILRRLSNFTKGSIGEGFSIGWNTLKGSTLLARNSRIFGSNLNTVADSQWTSLFGKNYVVESKFGTSTLTAAQREAQNALGNQYVVERWGYQFFTALGSVFGGAAGGAGNASLGNSK
jgi:hypothetical protein